MRRNKRFSILLLILIMLVSTLLSGAASAGIGTEKVKVIIAFHEQPGPAEEALIRAFGGSVKFTYHIVPAIAATLPQAALEGLSRNPNVKLIELDGEVHALADSYPWGIKQVGAETVHIESAIYGEGVSVAVIDTGMDYTHPDLSANYGGGYDFVNKDYDPMDDNGHGTHVAGTIAAELDGAGIVGVAPNTKIYALKVLNRRGSGDFSNIIAALDWCVAFNKINENDIRITNNSYGSSANPDLYGYTMEQAFIAAYDAGILHIAAAGNEGDSAGDTDTVGYPAKYESVVAVAATDSNNVRAYFSSTGNTVELSAPGYGIYSTVLRGAYATYNGTSMASPHVAGVAALVMAAHPEYLNTRVRTILQETATDLNNPYWYGHGLVNAVKAIGDATLPSNSAPSVSIESPAANSTFSSGYTINFIGTAIDDIDTNLSGQLEWSSSKDGPIGTGKSVFAVLSDGLHTITASVTDSGGLTGSASINITVNQNLPPDNSISVSSLIGSSSTVNKNFWKAQVVATVNPVLSGAVVTGTFGGLTVSGTTDGSGKCTLSSGNISIKTGSIAFELKSVTLSGYTYIPPSPTTITISRP